MNAFVIVHEMDGKGGIFFRMMDSASQLKARGVDEGTEGLILARLYGEPLSTCPEGLYIPPEALRIFLTSFEGPLDLLLYLIRKQKFDIMDIPMAELTEQYMRYVDLVRENDLELAAAYLVMSATLMQIKSRLLLPSVRAQEGEEVEDPRAELMRRLEAYEQIRAAALQMQALPRIDRDFKVATAELNVPKEVPLPDVEAHELVSAWGDVVRRLRLRDRHKVSRQELSVREHMSALLRKLSQHAMVTLSKLWEEAPDRETQTVWFLAMLELAKEEMVIVTQAAPYAPIYITLPEGNEETVLRCPDPLDSGLFG